MNIKNCPFCGNNVELKKIPLWSGSHGYYGCYEYVISCDICGCNKHMGNNNTVYFTDEVAKQNALNHWNKRGYGDDDYIDNIINGLLFTVNMFMIDPISGENLSQPRNSHDEITIKACLQAIEILKKIK